MTIRKQNKFISLGISLSAAVALLFLGLYFKNNYFLISILLGIVAITVFANTFLDDFMEVQMRGLFYALALLFVIGSLVGVMLNEQVMSVDVYSLVFGGLEIVSGILKSFEAVMTLIKKRKIGIFMLIDGVAEIVMGILMLIEKEEALRLHVNLIVGEKVYEGAVKTVNAFLEEKHHQKESVHE